jgi:Cu-processing system ATP-binding protein
MIPFMIPLMIQYRAFTKRYGSLCAVDALNLDVEPGEVVALLGPNGSGKTTALKAAAGLLHPTSGEVLLGVEGLPAGSPEARRALSFLPQKATFPDACSGREVLEFYRRLRGAPASRVSEVLRFASLNGAGARAVGTYSGGMAQRLGLAVAMLPDAPILLLDEPTAALDPDGLCAFYGVVEQYRRDGRTVFFTSHQLGDVERLADRFAVLVEGRLAAALTQSELADRLADRGLLRVRLAAPLPPDLLEEVRRIAPRALIERDQLLVPGQAGQRPAVLEFLHRHGREITGLATEDGRLDTLYLELVRPS